MFGDGGFFNSYFNFYHSCVVGEESIPDPDEKIIER